MEMYPASVDVASNVPYCLSLFALSARDVTRDWRPPFDGDADLQKLHARVAQVVWVKRALTSPRKGGDAVFYMAPGIVALVRRLFSPDARRVRPKFNQVDCPICLSGLRCAKVTTLPCRHVLHTPCWKTACLVPESMILCPICGACAV